VTHRSEPKPGKCIVMFSGGMASFLSAHRAIQRFRRLDTTLLFADTKSEDEDLYRFVDEGARALAMPHRLEKIADGRDIWGVCFDVKFIANSRVDPCSRILKRDLMRKWIEENHDPATTTIVLGYDWTEPHRIERIQARWGEWSVWCPLADEPHLNPADYGVECRRLGVEPPRLYAQGFAHNNCGGFCFKAGLAAFERLLRVNPCLYARHEAQEERFRREFGKDVTVLRDRSGGKTTPLTMREFRERIESEGVGWFDQYDIGGCSCMEEVA
jgi:hypothetical protein